MTSFNTFYKKSTIDSKITNNILALFKKLLIDLYIFILDLKVCSKISVT